MPAALPPLVFILVVAGVIVTVVKDVYIRINGKRWRLDFSAIPLIGVAFLVITTATPLRVVWQGIAGDESIKPYSILTLFMSLAYISVSVDKTGLFAWLALLIGRRAGSATQLFLLYYAFSAIMVRWVCLCAYGWYFVDSERNSFFLCGSAGIFCPR